MSPWKCLAFLIAAVALSGAVPPWTGDMGNGEKARFEQQRGERHKWKRGQALPESFADAGLKPDATLAWMGRYLDGGTVGYLLKDSDGNYLALCTGPGLQSRDNPRRIEEEVGSRLFVGDIHYRKEGAQIVPVGSKSEAWLKRLLLEKVPADQR